MNRATDIFSTCYDLRPRRCFVTDSSLLTFLVFTFPFSPSFHLFSSIFFVSLGRVEIARLVKFATREGQVEQWRFRFRRYNFCPIRRNEMGS